MQGGFTTLYFRVVNSFVEGVRIMMVDRHQPKRFEEENKDTCKYCRRSPAMWNQVGNEKECAYCGTRVYSSVLYLLPNSLEVKPAER